MGQNISPKTLWAVSSWISLFSSQTSSKATKYMKSYLYLSHLSAYLSKTKELNRTSPQTNRPNQPLQNPYKTLLTNPTKKNTHKHTGQGTPSYGPATSRRAKRRESSSGGAKVLQRWFLRSNLTWQRIANRKAPERGGLSDFFVFVGGGLFGVFIFWVFVLRLGSALDGLWSPEKKTNVRKKTFENLKNPRAPNTF